LKGGEAEGDKTSITRTFSPNDATIFSAAREWTTLPCQRHFTPRRHALTQTTSGRLSSCRFINENCIKNAALVRA